MYSFVINDLFFTENKQYCSTIDNLFKMFVIVVATTESPSGKHVCVNLSILTIITCML